MADVVVKIGGQALSQEMADDLLKIVVDTSLHMPDMATILLHDYALTWVDDTSLDVGKEIEVTADSVLLFKGEITAIEPEFDETGRATLVLRGYDKSHRLHRGKKSRTFLNMKDSDIARQIAGEAGLSAQVDATLATHEWVLQNNQTNMEFLLSRAERNGYQVLVADGSLYFKTGEWTLGAGPTLEWEDSLRCFRPRLTTAHQANTVVVHGWDAKAKQSIQSQATQSGSLNQGGIGQTGGAKAQSAFGEAKEVVVACPVATVDEASALAAGLSNDLNRESVQAEGVCFGNPAVKAGKTVTISGVGTRFGGKYFVTSATHVITLSDGRYETAFSASGRQPDTLHHLLDTLRETGDGRMLGVVTGMVTNQNDPDNLGRVKVKFPWYGSDPAEIESHWVRIAAPMAGAQRGFFYLPEINDEVLVAFEHGDVHRPYIVGALWSSTDKPPKQNSEAVADGKVNQRVLKTRSGHLIILDDKQGEEQISVTSKSGHKVILDDKSGSEKITIQDKTGCNEMVIDSTKNSMTIKVGGDFSVTATGKITLKSTADMTLEATGKSSIKGTAGLNLESPAQAALKGLTVDVTGNTTVKVAGSAMTQIQGGVVKIN